MAKNAEQLALPVKVKCRSTGHLILRGGTLMYNEDMQMVEIEFSKTTQEAYSYKGPFKGEPLALWLGPSTTIMKLSSISSVKAMDYIEGTRVNCVLIIRLRPEPSDDLMQVAPDAGKEEEVIVQFARVEDRDNWDTGLRYLINALEVTVAKDQVEVPTRSFSRIKKVRLEEPRAGILVRGRFELASGEEPELEIPESMADGKDLNTFVVDWVQRNCVQPSETTSLYRLVKSLVHRATLESKTADIIQRINDTHFDKLLKEHPGDPQATLEISKAYLREVGHDIPKLIGQQGTASAMVIQILQRNVEKMKVINDMAYRIHIGETDQHVTDFLKIWQGCARFGVEIVLRPQFGFKSEQTNAGKGCTTTGVCKKSPTTAGLQDLCLAKAPGKSFMLCASASWRLLLVLRTHLRLTNVNFDNARFEAYLKQSAALAEKMEKKLADHSGPYRKDIFGVLEMCVYGLKGVMAYFYHAEHLQARSRLAGEELVKVNDQHPAVQEDKAAAYDEVERTEVYQACNPKKELLRGLWVEPPQELYRIGAFLCSAGTRTRRIEPQLHENLKVMKLLDAGHNAVLGTPEPTQVKQEPPKGPAILVSGHDLSILGKLLEQCKGRGVNVYTHGEMLPAHSYPGLKNLGVRL
ncbi:Hydroxylamine reductase [Symbiodinium microadriaticum]|uniref:Hydroxylamine reductase n=1 Tax=Symbiodinium microadriaticum TaxID=2951 RepID=A0A1Q9D6C2_SYMMI|nr:Hydroxylamine reductase [Symbiodinium microadriaticum]